MYNVKLEVFEGPLDLLLFLIKKDEIDIYDIPIAAVTQQYMQYLELMELLDLEIAGEFIVMAATLMHIKSKTLLPPEPAQGEAGQELDPRAELVKRLLEYKAFKEAAGRMQAMEAGQMRLFSRPGDLSGLKSEFEGEYFFEATLFDLLSAFCKTLENIPKQAFIDVEKDTVTVEDKIKELTLALEEKKTVFLSALLREARSKMDIITTFLALLELIKAQSVFAAQEELFGEIRIGWRRSS